MLWRFSPRHDPPGSLRESELRALWRLRTSLLRLKPDVDPDQDYANFRRFVDAAYVGRLVDGDGRPRAMICHQRHRGQLGGQRYQLALFEYGFVDHSVRGHPGVSLALGRQLLTCRSGRPGTVDYFAGVGYPRSAVLVHRAVPDLRLGSDPGLTALERALVDEVIERMGPSKFDRQRCVAELPTIPEPIRPDWAHAHADHPLLSAYLAAVPDWDQGRAAVLIGRLDGSLLTVGREVGRRLGARARA